MKKFSKSLLVFFLAVVMAFTMSGLSSIPARADEEPVTPVYTVSKTAPVVSVARPKISVKEKDGQVTLTIKKTKNALGYEIYVKAEGMKDYVYAGNIDQDGTKKRTHTVAIDNSKDGVYYVRIRAFNGTNQSKYSKAKKIVIEGNAATGKETAILFTSDVHCGIDQGFTYVGLKAVKDALSKDYGYQVLLVDNGDSIQGESIGTLTKGEAIIELMNAVGYDIAIPGNHEFDYGMDNFLELTKKANFPYISCNLNKEGKLVLEPYVIKKVNGMKIAFVGVDTPKTFTSSTPRYFMNDKGEYIYGFMQDDTGEKLYNAIQKAVDDARKDGADYVVAMCHLGNEYDCQPWTYVDVISHTNGIDVLIDGHSHDTDKNTVENKDGKPILRQACGTKLSNIGYVTIAPNGEIDTGLLNWNNNNISAVELFGLRNEVSDVMEKELQTFDAKLKEVVAKTDVQLTVNDPVAKDDKGNPIRIVRMTETNLGDLCADAYLDQSGADVAIVNAGGIRANIASGDITFNDIISVHPFGNMLTVIEVTGQQLLDALEWGCRVTPSSTGGFPQVAGMTFEIHTYIDSSCTLDENGLFTGVTGEYRVKNVKINGQDLDLKKTYTLASTDYTLLNHGDGYNMFNDCKVTQNAVKIDNQVLIDYITGTLSGIVGEKYSNPYGEGRIVAVEQ